MTINLPPGLVVAFLLALVRASAWVVVAPPFNNRMIPVQVKIGLAAALALAVAPHLAEHVSTNLDTPALIGAITVQVGVGLILAFVANVLMSAITTAGSLIDLFGGFTIAQAYDPFSNATSSMFARVYQLLMITLLFAIDGHILLVRGFLTSFDAVGATGLQLGNASNLLLKDLGLFFLSAVEIAGPLLGALFLSEVVLGLLSRAAPQLNVLSLSFPLKIFLTLSLVSLALPLLPNAVSSLAHEAVRGGLSIFG
ncbi:MAG: flagellar biosynthesis protein FliR [Acidimicrobiaceae bacterium]|nr:flagellar biosynthesis protein FliR [Acidimicrobiaceae bacterium]